MGFVLGLRPPQRRLLAESVPPPPDSPTRLANSGGLAPCWGTSCGLLLSNLMLMLFSLADGFDLLSDADQDTFYASPC